MTLFGWLVSALHLGGGQPLGDMHLWSPLFQASTMSALGGNTDTLTRTVGQEPQAGEVLRHHQAQAVHYRLGSQSMELGATAELTQSTSECENPPCTSICSVACTQGCTISCTFECTSVCTGECTWLCTYSWTAPCTEPTIFIPDGDLF